MKKNKFLSKREIVNMHAFNNIIKTYKAKTETTQLQ